MKHISNILKTFGLVACAGLATTSCDVELMPLNEVVLENYWTEKSDVENVLTSCYTAMMDGAWMERIVTWGEVRSDNIAEGADVGAGSALQNIIKGNLKQNNSECQWVSLYTVINRCNTLIYYAPQVAEKDPNLTTSDLNSYVAQAKGIRALNYFYLIRTFKDVPFTFEPSISDEQSYVLPATADTKILDTLIMDIEACKDQAPMRYTKPASTAGNDDLTRKNTGRITRTALYALLADMYLWRASDANLDVASQQYYYKECVKCADYVINAKIDEYEDRDNGLTSFVDSWVYTQYGYPLLGSSKSQIGTAADEIFGDGNSWESIFEITYPSSESGSPKNTTLTSLYGQSVDGNSSYQLAASTTLLSNALTSSDVTYSDNSLFSVTTDSRSLTSFHYSESKSKINKYVVDKLSNVGTCEVKNWAAGNEQSWRSNNFRYPNWIVYRLPDVMLMRAEAEIQLAGILNKQAAAEEEDTTAVAAKARRAQATDGSSLSTAEEYYQDAFNIILAVYMRSNVNAQSASTTYRPNKANYTSYDDYMSLLENERHREFLFEGKRYYDLVRRARREGNTSHFASAIATKFGEASRAILIKMAMMDFMYMPYAESELDVNTYLHQNSAYAEDEERVLN